MNNGYEYYYLFGLDIPLEQYRLGTIKQPKLIDYLSKDINIESFYMPFVMNDVMIGQLETPALGYELKEKIGSLTFLMSNCIRSNKLEIITLLLNSIKIIYDTDDVDVSNEGNIKVKDIVISNSNFDTLCSVVLEMLKIDKSKMKFDKVDKKELSDIEREFERRRIAYEQKTASKKQDGLSFSDIANMLIHENGIDYEKVLNMTIYQIKNSYDITSRKESYEFNLLHRISPKFDMSKEKFEHWKEKIKLDKSTLSR